VGNESAIKVAESKEAAYFLYSGGYRPISDSFNFNRVHPNLAIADDYSQVLDFLLMEVTFFRFKEEVVFHQFI
jgi:hypothetical protein